MVTNDVAILDIKHRVMLEVARLAWEGKLEEEQSSIPNHYRATSPVSLLYL